jgi:hypothetical protein
MKHHHIGLILVAIFLTITGIFSLNTPRVVEPDELLGTWHAGSTNSEGLEWWMEYTFENGGYELVTGTDYGEKGTYTISERFLDGSIIVTKVFADGAKTYDMVVLTVDDPNMIFIEGVQLDRVVE